MYEYSDVDHRCRMQEVALRKTSCCIEISTKACLGHGDQLPESIDAS